MVSSETSNTISELVELLKQDQSSPNPQFPHQAEYALRDERLVKALEKRFENNQTLTGISSLGQDFATSLIHICFEFSQPNKISLTPDALLVILDTKTQIVAVIDPFKGNQFNYILSPSPKRGALPFVIARPSGATNLTFTQQDLAPREERSREFFQKLQPMSSQSQPSSTEELQTALEGTFSMCNYSTETNTVINYTCQQITGFLAPTCDAWGPTYVTDYANDQYACDSLD